VIGCLLFLDRIIHETFVLAECSNFKDSWLANSSALCLLHDERVGKAKQEAIRRNRMAAAKASDPSRSIIVDTHRLNRLFNFGIDRNRQSCFGARMRNYSSRGPDPPNHAVSHWATQVCAYMQDQ
jgi:hypothetical protein